MLEHDNLRGACDMNVAGSPAVSKGTIRVRPARHDDLDYLFALGVRMQSESLTRFPAVERDRVAKQLELTLAHPRMMLAALAVDETEAIGMVTAVAGDYAFSTERRTSCDMLFVLPERRGAIAAVKLVRHFEEWSRGVGAKTAIMGISTGVHPDRTAGLFQKLGFLQMGVTYSKALDVHGN